MKKQLLIGILFSVLALPGFNSYGSAPNNKAKGLEKTELRMIPAFTMIENHVNAKLHILKGKNYSVILTSREKLISEVKTVVVDGKLIISSDQISSTLTNIIEIEIYTQSLDEFLNKADGDVLSEIPISSIIHYGSGNIMVTGKSETVKAELLGLGSLDLSGFEVNSATISLSGSGNIKTFVRKHLQVLITGTGIVYYKGKPEIERAISGKGDIVDVN